MTCAIITKKEGITMLSKIKKTFLTKSFLTFCIIGGLAYLLHQGIYLLYTKTFGFYDDKNHLISTAIAFTVASIFTYFANAKFTYDTKAKSDTAIKSLVVFIVKFVITEGLTLGIMAIMKHNFSSTDLFYKIVDIMLPLILTCITLVLQFIAFNLIFKSKEKNE